MRARPNYSRFDYTNLTVEPTTATTNETVIVSVEVTNVGDR
jgi:hypothetical protein